MLILEAAVVLNVVVVVVDSLHRLLTRLGSFLQQRRHQCRVLAAAGSLLRPSGAVVVGSLQHGSMFHQTVHLVKYNSIIH